MCGCEQWLLFWNSATSSKSHLGNCGVFFQCLGPTVKFVDWFKWTYAGILANLSTKMRFKYWNFQRNSLSTLLRIQQKMSSRMSNPSKNEVAASTNLVYKRTTGNVLSQKISFRGPLEIQVFHCFLSRPSCWFLTLGGKKSDKIYMLVWEGTSFLMTVFILFFALPWMAYVLVLIVLSEEFK